ncbi:hypothetical protein HPG69_014141, partial [Diceros bicornis minor]
EINCLSLSWLDFQPSFVHILYVPKSKAGEATKVAIDVGFHHIDVAYCYENKEEISKALQDKIVNDTVKRRDIFYTTKVLWSLQLWNTFLQPELVRPALERSRQKLGLDLFIVHVPITTKALEKCKDAGLTKSIGVSNFSNEQLEVILTKTGLKHKPVCNQDFSNFHVIGSCILIPFGIGNSHLECHSYLNQSNLLEFCKCKDIFVVAYSALVSQRPKLVMRIS